MSHHLSPLQAGILRWLDERSFDGTPVVKPWVRRHPFPTTTASERAVLSRSLTRLVSRGLVGRNPRKVVREDDRPWRDAYFGPVVWITEAGRAALANKFETLLVSQSEPANENIGVSQS